MPASYNAWLIFRNIVDSIIANEVLAFLVFAVKNIEPVDSGLEVLSIVVGLVLGYVVLDGFVMPYIYIYIYIYACVCMHVCVCVLCVCVCVCVCVYVCVSIL
jgi:hypothetical protein